MRTLLAVILLALLLVPAAAHGASTRTTYIALGDSLAVGVGKANRTIRTDQGYADRLLKRMPKGTRLRKLGCPFETTASISTTARHDIGECAYPGGLSQLRTAERLLRQHRNDRRLYVTIDIGANDLAQCVTDGAIDLPCVGRGLQAIEKNVPKILKRIRTAAPRARLAGMTLYDPFLAGWYDPATRDVAVASASIAKDLNTKLRRIFKAAGAGVASVDTVFRTYDDTPGAGGVPRNVAEICRLTFMCPSGNLHPKANGYALIASSFARALRLP